MASKYEISAVFKLIDRITTPLDKVGKSGKSVGKALKRDFMAAQDSLDKFGKKLKQIGGYAIGAGIAAAGAGVAIATKQYIEFDNAVTAASAKFKDLNVKSETYADTLKNIGKKARDVAAITEFTAVDTSGALDKMAMAGMKSDEAMALLKGTTNLATATCMDLTTAVDIATDAMGAFNLTKDEFGKELSTDALSANLDRVSDVVARTTNMFNTDISMWFEAVQKGAPVFIRAGQSVEDFSALVGALANSGIKGAEAGTALRNVIMGLTPSSDKAAGALEAMGIRVKNSAGNMNNIMDIIGDFEKSVAGTGAVEKFANAVKKLEVVDGVAIEDQMEGLLDSAMGNVDQISKLTAIFGKRTVASMLVLLAEGSDKLKEYSFELKNAKGAAADIAEAMRGSIKNKIEALKSALTELGFKFVESFHEKGVGLIEKLTDAITKFDPQPVIDAVVSAGNAIGGIIKIVWQLRQFVLGVAIAWGIYKTAMIAAVVVGKIMGMVKAVQKLMAAQKGMNAVQALFNVLLNANPIGLIITAVGILIGLFILAYQKCEPFRNAVNGILEKLKALGAHILQVLAPAFETMKSVFQKVISVIGEIFGTVGRLISIFSGLFNITGQVSGSFSFLDSVLKIVSGTIQFVCTLLGGIVDTIGALFSGINDIIDAFKNGGFIAGIKQIGLSILNYILTPIKAMLDAISIIPGIGDMAKGASEKIGQFQEKLQYHHPESEVEQAAPIEAASAPVNTVPPQITAPAAPVNTVPGTAAAPRAVNQPVFLQLQNPIPGGETVTQRAAGPASPWSVPVTYTGGTMPDITEAASIPAEFDIGDYDIDAAPVNAAPRQITAPAAPQIAGPVSVPVKYEFPDLIVPPELIHPVTITVQWSVPTIPPLPLPQPENAFRRSRAGRTATEAVSGRITRPIPAQAGRLIPQAVAHNDPARVDRIVPPAVRTPITGTTAEAMTPQAPPMTRAEQITAEQIINSRTEHKENVNVMISLDKGLQARVVNPPKSPNVKLEISGDA